MPEKEITCIVCPIGCKILVKTDGSTCEIVEGNKCKQGIDYAKSEALDPQRVLTSSVLVENGDWPLVSVKTSIPIPKNKILDVLQKIKNKKVGAPIKSSQIIIKNVAETGADIIATKSIKTIKK
jgi:CxxC motif-containing protein